MEYAGPRDLTSRFNRPLRSRGPPQGPPAQVVTRQCLGDVARALLHHGITGEAIAAEVGIAPLSADHWTVIAQCREDGALKNMGMPGSIHDEIAAQVRPAAAPR